MKENKKKLNHDYKLKLIILFGERQKKRENQSKTSLIEEISKELNLNKRTSLNIINKYLIDGSLDRKKGSGRKRKTSKREDRLIKKVLLNDSKESNNNIVLKLKDDYNISISERTLRDRGKEFELKQEKEINKMRLSQYQKDTRLNWCLKFKEKDLNFWTKVIFSDESTFFLVKGSHYIWTRMDKDPDSLSPIKNIKASITIWGCINFLGVGILEFITQTINSERYIHIIENCYLPSTDLFMTSENGPFILMQDNAKPHVSKKTLKVLKKNHIRTLEWPPRSPDLNPIENLWAIIDKKIRKNSIENVEGLKKVIKNTWYNIGFSHDFQKFFFYFYKKNKIKNENNSNKKFLYLNNEINFFSYD